MTSGAPRLILERHRPLRLFTLFILYVGQGLPIGLFWFAIPAWMAVNGAGAGAIGTVAAFTALPWSLKLVHGFLMDRYSYLPMGRRRAWILGAQIFIVIGLLAAALAQPLVGDAILLAAVGFAVNLATTVQDVAVDGLAVDIMTEDERARGSGMMFGGQSLGIAAASALSAYAIETAGVSSAFLVVAALMAVLSAYVACFRERNGERQMPWSAGAAHPRSLSIQSDAWWPLLKTTFLSLTRGVSLLWLPVLFSRGVLYGAFAGATPLIGANHAGWSTMQIASLTASAGLLAGVLAMTLGGYLGDRFGAKRIGILWFCAQLCLATAMFAAAQWWGNPAVFTGFVIAWMSLDLLLTVALLPISMRLCAPTVAATQFAIYMAVSNLGISAGAFALAQTAGLGGLRAIFLMVGSGIAGSLVLLLTVRYPRRPEFYAREAEVALAFDSAVAIGSKGRLGSRRR